MLPKYYCYLKSLLSIILCLLLVAPIYAQTIDQKKTELESVQEEIGGREKELEENKTRAGQLQEEIRVITIQLGQAKEELEQVNRDIQETEENIVLKEIELGEAEERLQEQDDLIKVRLRAIYENGNVSYLEVLFSSSSFNDFLTRSAYLKTILDQDVHIFDSFQRERDIIQGHKLELEDHRTGLLNLRRVQVEKQEQIERQSRERSRLLGEVRSEIEAQERAIRELEAESQKIEEIIKRMQEEEARRAAAITPGGTILWPLAEFGMGYITSGFGYRVCPITRQARAFHGGIDIGIPHSRWPGSPSYGGTPVNILASEAGTVIYAGLSGSLSYGYGRVVILDHGGGVSTVYAHAHSILVSVGEEVSRGQAIATVGSTGSSTGPHLHFEVREGGTRVNPLNYFN